MTELSDRDRHLFASGPKRILALDGGGIRGALSLQILRRIEALVRCRLDDPEARLCDYFDLIGGTSTGAILAAGLATGGTVDELEGLYRRLGSSIFRRRWHRWGFFRAKFSARQLRSALKREFRDLRMGSPEVRTGLAIIAKRLDTGSPWVLHNNPLGKYYGPDYGGEFVPNKNYPLRNVLRASAAAPHYFRPESIQVAPDFRGAFIDGGMSPHNNPALQLFLLATLRGHKLSWSLGEDELLLVSVGTGSQAPVLTEKKVMGMLPAALTLRSLMSMMDDATALNETVLQWLSRSPTAREIDSEMGDLSEDLLVQEPLLTYLRYDVVFDHAWLQQHLDLSIPARRLAPLHKMDRAANMDLLVQIGRAAADRLVEERHFPPAFDRLAGS